MCTGSLPVLCPAWSCIIIWGCGISFSTRKYVGRHYHMVLNCYGGWLHRFLRTCYIMQVVMSWNIRESTEKKVHHWEALSKAAASAVAVQKIYHLNASTALFQVCLSWCFKYLNEWGVTCVSKLSSTCDPPIDLSTVLWRGEFRRSVNTARSMMLIQKSSIKK